MMVENYTDYSVVPFLYYSSLLLPLVFRVLAAATQSLLQSSDC